MRQEIRFCSVGDWRVALASVGSGPPLVMPSWWTSHLELDWGREDFRTFVQRLAEHHTVVRYDRLGTGMSDRVRPAQIPAADLEAMTFQAVLDALELDRVDVFGMSCGGCIGVDYAAAHPERVGRLVLYGCYVHGEKIAPAPAREAMVALVRAHWGMGTRMLAEMFLPGSSAQQRQAFVAFQREAADPELAADLLALVYAWDVREQAARVTQPTLVLHRRRDRAVPYELAREIATLVPDARFVTLEGEHHLPWLGESGAVAEATLAFTAGGQAPAGATPAPGAGDLSDRQREVLALVAGGLSDQQIADALVLSPHTVHRHVANIRTKLRQPTRAAAVAEAARLGLV